MCNYPSGLQVFKSMKHLIVNKNKNVLTIALNRAEKYNALNNDLISELNEVFAKAIMLNVNAVFITASEKVFCAGGDLNEMKNLNLQQAEQQSMFVQNTFKILQEIPVPVVAFISGICYGGGLELALHADFRICTNTCKMAMPEVKYGIIPGGGGTVLLPQKLNADTAKYYLCTGAEIPLQLAYNQGLIQKIIQQNELEKEINEQTNYFNSCNRDTLVALKSIKKTNNNTDLYKQEAKLFASLLQKNGINKIENLFNNK